MHYLKSLKHCLTFFILFTVSNAQTVQNTVELRVDDPRPVAAAIQDLVARYGYVITYEDPRHVYSGDLQDVTAKVRKDLDKYPPGKAPRVIVPAEATLILQVPHSTQITTQAMASVLQQLMQAQSRTGQGGQFRVEQVADVFHVLPTAARDQNANWIAQTPILETPISMPMKDRSGDGMVNSICNAVSAQAHVKISLGFSVGGISDPARPRPYRLGADHERARLPLTVVLFLRINGQIIPTRPP